MTPIDLTNIVKKFGDTTAVNNVTFQIGPGELFFLLGPSGCGKSTLLRMIAGLIQPTSGKIMFGEREVTKLPTGKRNAAMVFQGYALWPHMTVAQNVEFGLNVRDYSKQDREEMVASILEVVRMTPYADRRPAALSGGQQQRVALARALVVRPDVLLLDEPLSNLDAKLRIEMRDEIRRICNETNVTTVYVTHDQEEALSMANRIAVMKDGVVCQVGPPRELYEKPASRFVAGFLGHTNLIDAKVESNETNRFTLSSSIGQITSTYDFENSNKDVTCSIRPESVRIMDNGVNAENVYNGKVVESIYLGHVAQHVVELADRVQVIVNELKPRKVLEPDQAVSLGFDSSDVVLLHE